MAAYCRTAQTGPRANTGEERPGFPHQRVFHLQERHFISTCVSHPPPLCPAPKGSLLCCLLLSTVCVVSAHMCMPVHVCVLACACMCASDRLYMHVCVSVCFCLCTCVHGVCARTHLPVHTCVSQSLVSVFLSHPFFFFLFFFFN